MRLLKSHPLNATIVKIITKPIQDAYLKIKTALVYKRPGFALMAKGRYGKTTMIIMISEKLAAELPEVAHGFVSAQTHDAPTEKAFWTDILDSLLIEAVGTAADRKKILRNYVIAACAAKGGNHFALYIDEAQCWGETEFTLLRNFANLLEKPFGITLTTISVGDPNLVDVQQRFIANGRRDLWGRFLRSPLVFHGISTVQDLAEFMARYDDIKHCEYPVGSGVCYSEIFLPDDFKDGWRLMSEAPALMAAFKRSAASVNQPMPEIGMQWIKESILSFLRLKMKEAAGHEMIDPSPWDAAVKSSDFAEWLCG